MSFLLSLVFSLHKIREQEGGTGSPWGEGEVAQTMYTPHVSKCKNNTKKERGRERPKPLLDSETWDKA
jgi:hypothetical protein